MENEVSRNKSIKMTDSLIRQIENLAKTERRTFSDMVRIIIEDALLNKNRG